MTKSYLRSLSPKPTQEFTNPCTRVSEDDPESIQTPSVTSHLISMPYVPLKTTLIVMLHHVRSIHLSVLVYMSLDTHPPALICCQYMKLKNKLSRHLHLNLNQPLTLQLLSNSTSTPQTIHRFLKFLQASHHGNHNRRRWHRRPFKRPLSSSLLQLSITARLPPPLYNPPRILPPPCRARRRRSTNTQLNPVILEMGTWTLHPRLFNHPLIFQHSSRHRRFASRFCELYRVRG